MHFAKAVFAAMVGSLLSLIVAVIFTLIIGRRYRKRYDKMMLKSNPFREDQVEQSRGHRDPLMYDK